MVPRARSGAGFLIKVGSVVGPVKVVNSMAKKARSVRFYFHNFEEKFTGHVVCSTAVPGRIYVSRS